MGTEPKQEDLKLVQRDGFPTDTNLEREELYVLHNLEFC